MKKTMMLSTSEQVEQLGERLSKLPKPLYLFLTGDLGAGKTTLARGFLRGLGHMAVVKSPTYTLVESYTFNDALVHHFDFYRLKTPFEVENLGIRDYFADTYCLIEWPEKAAGQLAQPHLLVDIQMHEQGRLVTLTAMTTETMSWLENLHDI